MTNIPDARLLAWVAAHQRLSAAQAIVADRDAVHDDELPAYYWGLVAEAAAWAELAKVTTEVGLGAGAHMVQQEAAQQAEKARSTRRQQDIKKIFENFGSMKDAVTRARSAPPPGS